MTISARFERYFSAKHAVHDYEIADSQAHSECPPDQANMQGVGAGGSGSVSKSKLTHYLVVRSRDKLYRNRCAAPVIEITAYYFSS
jgi:hypothetical protein